MVIEPNEDNSDCLISMRFLSLLNNKVSCLDVIVSPLHQLRIVVAGIPVSR